MQQAAQGSRWHHASQWGEHHSGMGRATRNPLPASHQPTPVDSRYMQLGVNLYALTEAAHAQYTLTQDVTEDRQLLQDAGDKQTAVCRHTGLVLVQVQQLLIIQMLLDTNAEGDANTHRCSGCQGRWTRQGRDPEPALCQQTLICHIGQCPAKVTTTSSNSNAQCFISPEVFRQL